MAGEVQRLTDSKTNQYPGSWHPSGKFLAFQETNPQTAQDLMILPMEGDEASAWKPGKPTVFLNSPFSEREPMFSTATRSFDLHPDSERFALAAVPETQTAAKQDKLVFIFNFFDELKRIAPTGKR